MVCVEKHRRCEKHRPLLQSAVNTGIGHTGQVSEWSQQPFSLGCNLLSLQPMPDPPLVRSLFGGLGKKPCSVPEQSLHNRESITSKVNTGHGQRAAGKEDTCLPRVPFAVLVPRAQTDKQ